jgi:hypothetical protein
MFTRLQQLGLVVATLAGSMAGFAPPADGTASPPSLSCAAAPSVGVSVNLVLVGPTSGGSVDAQARLDAFDTVAASAYKSGSDLIVAEIGASAAQDHVVLAVSAEGVGVNGRYASADEECAAGEVVKTFLNVDKGPASGSADILGALETMSADLRSLRPSRVSVLIMSAGLQGAQPMDVADNPTLLDIPTTVARGLSAQGVLPNLHGWSVAFLSDGDTTDEQAQGLVALWWRVIEAAGGQLTGYENSILAWPLASMSEPKVPNYRPINPPTKIPIDLPDSTLFSINSAALLPTARPVISEVANLLTETYPNGTAELDCYADSAT